MPTLTLDTHDPAVQASAFRLIKILQDAYPDIARLYTFQEPVVIDSGASSSSTSSEVQSQVVEIHGSLISYLTKKILSEEENNVLRKSVPGVLQMVDYITKQPGNIYTEEEKRLVFEQMAVIACLCPGTEAWDSQAEQWSKNCFYNIKTGQIDTLMTSPAEALNLVCQAIFDTSRYLPSPEGDEEAMKQRVNSFFIELKKLRESTQIRHEHEKCSAGLQHDLLYLLQNAYLDKPRDVTCAKPVEILMDMSSFILSSFASFIGEQVNKFPGLETNEMIHDWMRWSIGAIEVETCPVITWLRAHYPSPAEPDKTWQGACTAYVNSQCERYGIDSRHLVLASYYAEFDGIDIPSMENVIIPFLTSLFEMPCWPVANTNSADDRVFKLANAALSALKTSPENLLEPRYAQSIKTLYRVLINVSSLYHYRNLTLYIGKEDSVFAEKRDALTHLLIDYFNSSAVLEERYISPLSFDCVSAAYREQERKFLADSHADFITDFFALLDWSTAAPLASNLQRLQALKPEGASIHPMVLSDDRLNAWREQHINHTGDGPATLDLTPYDINRVILHGFLQEPDEWTPLYCNHLIQITTWLSAPTEPEKLRALFQDETEEDFKKMLLALTTLKKTYPRHLLDSLNLIAWIAISDLHADVKRICFDIFKEYWRHHHKNSEPLYRTLLKNRRFSDQARSQLLTVVGRCISNVDALKWLFRFSPAQLTEAQRSQILTAIEDKLGTLISDSSDLKDLFSLSLEQLTEAQRSQILTAIEDKLGTLILNGYDLKDLFSLSPEQLTEAQRSQIFTAIEGKLGALIRNSSELKDLFSLSPEQLTEAQRSQILTAIEDKFGTLILNGSDIKNLFSLSLEQLTEAQRSQIFPAIKDKLGTIIRYSFELKHLFSLSPEQLTEAQRSQIFTAIKDKLGTLILNGYELKDLFSLSPEQLTEAQRSQIFKAKEGKLGTLIRDSYHLKDLFSLSPEQLTEAQRSQIFTAIKDKLGTLILNGSELKDLFSLSLEQLTEAQRSQILTAIGDKFDAKTKSQCFFQTPRVGVVADNNPEDLSYSL